MQLEIAGDDGRDEVLLRGDISCLGLLARGVHHTVGMTGAITSYSGDRRSLRCAPPSVRAAEPGRAVRCDRVPARGRRVHPLLMRRRAVHCVTLSVDTLS